MLKIQLHSYDTGFDPAPRCPSDAEIELADQLRRQLEERYFGHAVSPSPSPLRSGKDR